ncbi:hypothetical protein CONLIGDRAFT_355142 [Coniochaeta ligniaria NRRL 30616]|uniref:Uncharacterized protein n=1 Tax=Coniochaeta ligniaria NRRL 30616 TaxID=1408157 RepID=A0A1J7IRB7_9PEZI|nr:hypothetical protein CONLIGDRAFT_355142 [Coniochaeta ligniaria NRRL 30616]
MRLIYGSFALDSSSSIFLLVCQCRYTTHTPIVHRPLSDDKLGSPNDPDDPSKPRRTSQVSTGQRQAGRAVSGSLRMPTKGRSVCSPTIAVGFRLQPKRDPHRLTSTSPAPTIPNADNEPASYHLGMFVAVVSFSLLLRAVGPYEPLSRLVSMPSFLS